GAVAAATLRLGRRVYKGRRASRLRREPRRRPRQAEAAGFAGGPSELSGIPTGCSRPAAPPPSCASHRGRTGFPADPPRIPSSNDNRAAPLFRSGSRSEERRVGKECRSRWTPGHAREGNESTEKRGAL